MRLVIIEFVSLDGVVQAPGGPDEDTDGSFAHGGWSPHLADDGRGVARASRRPLRGSDQRDPEVRRVDDAGRG